MPLTTKGIEIQILSSVISYRKFRNSCSTNDCKVVVNHLIRKYSEPLSKSGLLNRRVSLQVKDGSIDDTIEDHAVPVIVLVEDILQWPDSHIEVTEENLRRLSEFLTASLLLVEVTRQEDATLSLAGFQRRMPIEWSEENNVLYRNPLARYIKASVNVE